MIQLFYLYVRVTTAQFLPMGRQAQEKPIQWKGKMCDMEIKLQIEQINLMMALLA